MPLFLCRWPDATVSLVEADDPQDAVLALDDYASAKAEWMQPFNVRNMHIEFKLDDHGRMILEHFDTTIQDSMKEIAFPAIAEVEGSIDREVEDYTPEDLERIADAMKREEEQV